MQKFHIYNHNPKKKLLLTGKKTKIKYDTFSLSEKSNVIYSPIVYYHPIRQFVVVVLGFVVWGDYRSLAFRPLRVPSANGKRGTVSLC